jgi:Membrane proteins related to metalloendopeptidases
MRTSKWILLQALVFALIISCGSPSSSSVLEEEKLEQAVEKKLGPYGFDTKAYRMEEGVIGKGQFFAHIMRELGVDNNTSYALTQRAQGVFDLRNLRLGNSYKAYYRPTETGDSLAFLVYEKDVQSFVLFGLQDSLSVSVGSYPMRIEQRQIAVVISQSLWEDIRKAGGNPLLALKLSDVYAWSIDFFGLQAGDHFTAVYEEVYVDDKAVDLRHVLAAVFDHNRKHYDAYRFYQDSLPGYWNEKGENVKKAFLKAPLNYTRVSSGFSYARKHPVTRIVRPHTGVDYAAPAGTPVMSIGDGRVIERGYSGGGGNTVKIKHNGTYTTAYLHLSKYAAGLAVGKQVRQGEVIGYVGSTGVSTGPHLDFRVWKDGQPINPLTMEAPSAEPLRAENMEAFAEYVAAMKLRL